MSWPFGDLHMFGYDVIDADPPWAFELRSEKGDKKSAQAQYDVMQLDEIAALPVGQLARADCLLTLWTCGWAMARGDAQFVAKAWGAEPISEIVWNKVTINGKRAVGPGYRVRTIHEPILVCTWGNPEHLTFDSSFSGVRREHSRKPDEWYEILVSRTPNALRRACLFSAGRNRPGFECWGHEHRTVDYGNGNEGTRPGGRLEPGGDRRAAAAACGEGATHRDREAAEPQLSFGLDQVAQAALD